MTEEEARTKWCPHYVASHTDPRAGMMNGKFSFNCIGSACMAWRWFPQSENYTERGDTGERTYLKQTGFCGLAGRDGAP